MRVKEINNKVAHIAWSPSSIYPNYIVSGSAAENPDTSNSNSASLELFRVDLSNQSTDLQIDASYTTESRFCKLIWTDYSHLNSKNIIIGGCENSKIYLYDYEKIQNYQAHLATAHDSSPLIKTLEKHTGNVTSLDINPFQHNLLASGAGQSEIFIWDLNNPAVPMTPGAKIQPLDNIDCVSWNNQVQHIMASTCGGKCVVWDLRKNESIIKVSDNMSKMKARLVSWHPEIATQMCLSSDDDQSPFLQIWDLRFATSPVRVLEGHQRGILAFRWCLDDSNLLISSAKDNRLICWNPNNPTCNGEILYELPTIGQWCFDLSWSRRNPDLVCCSSFEGQVNVYTLMGGKYNVIQQTSSKIMDSFGDVPTTPPAVSQQQQITQQIQQLKIAPKWMKRPCGARFAFGGKLVTFGRTQMLTLGDSASNDQANQLAQLNNQRVLINQVITDPGLVDKSQHLEQTLQTGNVIEYCNYKIETSTNESQSNVWQFILATFSQNKIEKYLELLGFSNENLIVKIKKMIHETNETDETESKTNGHLENTFDQSLSLNNNNNNSVNSFFNAHQIESEKVQSDNFDEIARALSPVNLSFKNDVESLIGQLLLLGKYDKAVDLCMQEHKYTDAILIANFFDKNLLDRTQKLYFKKNKTNFSSFLERFLDRDWSNIIETCNLNDWRDALAALLTYTSEQEFAKLCDKLGKRLEEDNLLNACICYILSFNFDSLVNCWQKLQNSSSEFDPDSSIGLQDLIEKVMVLKYSYQHFNQDLSRKIDQIHSHSKLNAKLIKYAKLLADQGSFLNAYSYVNDSNDADLLVMKDRIFNSLDSNLVRQYGLRKPECPFKIQQHQHVPTSHSSSLINRKNSYQTGYDNSLISNKQLYQPSQTNNNFYNPPSQQQHQHHQPQPTATTYRPPSTTPTNNYPIKAMNHPMPTSTIYAASYSNTVNNPIPPPPTTTTPFNPTPMVPPTSTVAPPPTSLFTPAAPQQQPSQLQSQQTPSMPSYMNTKPPTAWNDPPIVTPKIKQAAPIIKEQDMPQFFQPTMPTIPPQQQQIPAFNNQPFYPQAPTPITNTYSQPAQQTYNPVAAQIQQQRVQPSPQPQQIIEPPKPIEKGPIPSEHLIIQTVFDALLNKCLSVSNVPAIKRKLDDVAKKLDVLYDKLRDSTLSPSVLQGVHAMVQYIQAYDYTSSLQLHSQIVATATFSEISGFMPGIKVLIQSCQQLNVTL